MAGAVYSWTRTWHPFGGTEGIGVPFVTVVVELPQAGGLRLTGVLEGESADLKIGAPVHGAVGETLFNGLQIPTIRWRLAGADQ